MMVIESSQSCRLEDSADKSQEEMIKKKTKFR